MPGTLTISTLSDGTNSTSATNCIQGSAKAWVNFNGTITSGENRRASYNVSSVTRNGTGDYTINFTTSFVDANYALVATARYTGGGVLTPLLSPTSTPATSSCRIVVSGTNGVYNDVDYVNAAVFR